MGFFTLFLLLYSYILIKASILSEMENTELELV